jgi:hypothetical protein
MAKPRSTSTTARSWSDAELRRLLGRIAIGDPVGETCRAAGISPAVLRRHRQRLGDPQQGWTDADWVLAALAAARADTAIAAADVVEWIDWRNHVRLAVDDVERHLAEHARSGHARRTPQGWLLDGPWP